MANREAPAQLSKRSHSLRGLALAAGALSAGVFLVNGCGNSELTSYVADDGRYEVLMPRPVRTEVRTGPAGERIDLLHYERHDGAFGVVHKQSPISVYESESDLRKRLEDNRSWVFQGERGTITSETRLLLQEKWPGRKLEGKLPNNVRFRARLYLADGRLYQLIVIGKPSWVFSKDATRFLESFAVR